MARAVKPTFWVISFHQVDPMCVAQSVAVCGTVKCDLCQFISVQTLGARDWSVFFFFYAVFHCHCPHAQLLSCASVANINAWNRLPSKTLKHKDYAKFAFFFSIFFFFFVFFDEWYKSTNEWDFFFFFFFSIDLIKLTISLAFGSR